MLRSEPEKRGYRKRLLTIWNTQNTNHWLKDVSEQRLADQVRQIKVKKWLENVEQQEIYLRVRGEQQLNNTETTALAESIQEDRNSDNMQVEEESPDQTIPSVRQQEGGNTDTVIPNSPQQLVTGDDNNEATTDLKERILQVMLSEEKVKLPALRSCDRMRLMEEVTKVNEAVKMIQTSNISELNSLLYAAAYVTTERLGALKKRKKGSKTVEPSWKRRINGNITSWRKDLSRIEEVRKGKMKLKQRERERLNRKYNLEEKGILFVASMLKQKIRAGGRKIKRYTDRCLQFKQNRLFQTNQKLFYETLDESGKREVDAPDQDEITNFWRNIWSQEICHNEHAEWLGDVEHELKSVEKQENIEITLEDIKAGVSKMANWKAAGPDLVQGFWFKKLTGLHTRSQLCLQECIQQGNVPEWMVRVPKTN